MKLIDADKAFEVLSEYYHHKTDIQHDALREALDKVPEAVVRCDKCRWHYERGRDMVCGNSGDVVSGNDYCSYWERKSDER